MIKVSIIMPVYNSGDYLNKAVDSVLDQDFDDFELILVNDGSLDNSGEICDEYAKNNKKVKVIHKKNGGICSARNAGLKIAQGEYIGFCDNDDEYLPHLLRDNYSLAKECNADLMRYGKIKRTEREDGKVWEAKTNIRNCIIKKDEIIDNYHLVRCEDSVWTGLYKKKIIDNYDIKFDESFKYGREDENFNLNYLKHCEILRFNSKAYYIWKQREAHSTSAKFHEECLEDIFRNVEDEAAFINELGLTKDNKKQIIIRYINFYVYNTILYMTYNGCNYTLKEKAEVVKKIRYCKIFDYQNDKGILHEIFKENKKNWLVTNLFYTKHYKLLIFVLEKGISILSKNRYK